MIRSSLLVVVVCGLWTARSDAVGAAPYYPLYGVPASGYLLPAAYVPPYAAYQVPPRTGASYYGNVQQEKPSSQYDQQDTKYYYGGKFQGTCSIDGLYYKDDTTFVICSNGYASEQPCPPGTKTAGYPSYQAGYYYGYTDLCSVNLVDYGYGPSSYVTAAADNNEYREKSYGENKPSAYNSYVKESYSTPVKSSSPAYPTGTTPYQTPKSPSYQVAAYPSKLNSASEYRDSEYKNVYPQVNPFQIAAEASSKNNYQPQPSSSGSSSYSQPSNSNPYLPRDSSYTQQSSNGNAYPPKQQPAPAPAPYGGAQKGNSYQQSIYPSKGSSYPSTDTVYSPRDDYSKVTYPAAKGPAYPSSGDKRY